MMRIAWVVLLCVIGVSVATASDKPGDILRVDHAWIRLLPGELPAGGYFVIHNDGEDVHRLVGVTSDAFDHVMLHESVRGSGMERMRHVESVNIPPHGKIEFAPGGYHLMLMHAKTPLQVGGEAIVNLEFDDNEKLPVTFLVRPANAMDDGSGQD